MRIIERLGQDSPDRPRGENLPPFKLAISAAILVVGLRVAGLLAPSNGLTYASFGLAWSTVLALTMIAGAFALEARRNRLADGESA